MNKHEVLTFSTYQDVAGMQPCMKRPITVHAKQMNCEFRVNTLEGDYKLGKPGDYLMQGIEKELYICDKAIFEKTYDFTAAKLTAGVELPSLPYDMLENLAAQGYNFTMHRDKGYAELKDGSAKDIETIVRQLQRQAIAADRSRLAGQEPIGEISMCSVRPNASGMYGHEFWSTERFSVGVELFIRPFAAPGPAQAEKVEPVEIGAIAAAHDIGYSKKEHEDAEEILRLIATIKYLVGIAERGEGRKCGDDETPEQFVLGYVKRLESVDRQTDIYNFASWLTCRNAVIEVGSTCVAAPMAEALREYFERHCKQFSTTPPTAPQSLLDAAENEMLDFVLANAAFIVWHERDGSIKQCQLWSQDEDENILYLSGEHRYFNTERDAIRAALQEHGRKAT